MKIGRWLVLAGCLALPAGAVLHLSAYAGVAEHLDHSPLAPLVVLAAKVLWLLFAAQLIVICFVVFLASRNERGPRTALVCAGVLALETLVFLRLAGAITATGLLALATVLLGSGGVALRAASTRRA